MKYSLSCPKCNSEIQLEFDEFVLDKDGFVDSRAQCPGCKLGFEFRCDPSGSRAAEFLFDLEVACQSCNKEFTIKSDKKTSRFVTKCVHCGKMAVARDPSVKEGIDGFRAWQNRMQQLISALDENGDCLSIQGAIEELAKTPSEQLPVLIGPLRHENVRQNLLKVFFKIGERAVPVLIEELENKGKDSAVIARALGEIKDGRAVDPLIEIIKGKVDEWTVVENSISALGKIGGEKAMTALIKLLRERPPIYQAKKILKALKSMSGNDDVLARELIDFVSEGAWVGDEQVGFREQIMRLIVDKSDENTIVYLRDKAQEKGEWFKFLAGFAYKIFRLLRYEAVSYLMPEEAIADSGERELNSLAIRIYNDPSLPFDLYTIVDRFNKEGIRKTILSNPGIRQSQLQKEGIDSGFFAKLEKAGYVQREKTIGTYKLFVPHEAEP